MLKRLANILIVVALAASIGLHWAFLQSVAWSSMLAGNLRTESLTRAMELTFDGKHPCPLCKAIAQGKASERKTESTLSLKKLEFPPAEIMPPFTVPAAFPLCARTGLRGVVRLLSPPTPPPRSLFA